jgi:hypothetical protein
MQSEEGTQGPELTGYCDNKNIALLTRKEGDWLLGKLNLSKSYEYRLKSSIKRKIQTFVNVEFPLLIKNLIISYEPKSLRTGFGDGTYCNDSSLGKAKVPGRKFSDSYFSVSIVYQPVAAHIVQD